MTLPAIRDTHYVSSEETYVSCAGCSFKILFRLYGKREAMRLGGLHHYAPDRTMAELAEFAGVSSSVPAQPPMRPPASAEHRTPPPASGGERRAGAEFARYSTRGGA